MGIAPLTVITTATRHMLDANVTFGNSSDRFNARDKYRRDYDGTQRFGAGLGVAFGTALPALGLVAWLKKGAPVGIAPKNVFGTMGGKAVGAVALGAATYVGAKKMSQIVNDDGHLGAIGAATGIVAGTIAGVKLGGKFAGKYTPLVSGAAAIIGGIAGYQGAKHIKVGTGHIGEESFQAPNTDDGVLDRARSFARGAFTNFSEVGPATQGASLGYAWGMRETYKTKTSNAERAGSMHGDLLAAGILGGGALAVAAGLMGQTPYAIEGATAVKSGFNQATNLLGRGMGTQFVNKLAQVATAKTAATGAAAGLLAGVVALKEWDRAKDSNSSDAAAGVWVGAHLAATAGLAYGISKTHALSGLGTSTKAASSALVAAALIGVISSARLPIQQFVNDARDAHGINGKTNWAVAAPAMAVGSGSLALTANKMVAKIVPEGGVQLGKFHLSKGLLVGIGTAVGAIGGAGAGWGLSATMPDLKTTAISTAVGTGLGAAAGALFGGIGIKTGAVAGAMLGMSASALVRGDEPKLSTPTAPGVRAEAA